MVNEMEEYLTVKFFEVSAFGRKGLLELIDDIAITVKD